jgi:hypothetical protein
MQRNLFLRSVVQVFNYDQTFQISFLRPSPELMLHISHFYILIRIQGNRLAYRENEIITVVVLDNKVNNNKQL